MSLELNRGIFASADFGVKRYFKHAPRGIAGVALATLGKVKVIPATDLQQRSLVPILFPTFYKSCDALLDLVQLAADSLDVAMMGGKLIEPLFLVQVPLPRPKFKVEPAKGIHSGEAMQLERPFKPTRWDG